MLAGGVSPQGLWPKSGMLDLSQGAGMVQRDNQNEHDQGWCDHPARGYAEEGLPS